MSLKAKMEAVIYASEEPVTLAQLVSLLGEEAQAELEREQHQLDLQAAEDATGDGESAPVEAAAEEVASAEVVELDEVAEPAEGAAEPAVAAEPPAETAPETDADAPEGDGSGKKKKLTEAEKAAARKLREYFRGVLEGLMKEYAETDRGLEIREVAGGYRFATKPEYHDAVRGFVKSLKPPLKLSLPALETLAVIAYKQPVTAPEIGEIRGVDSGGVLGSLVARKLITTAGRKQVIGRPILYKTTKDFLMKFGLKDIAELPSIEEFEKMAGELAEQEEIPMGEPSVEGHDASQAGEHTDMEEENAVEPQADGDSSATDEVVVDEEPSEATPSEEPEPTGEEPQEQEEVEASDTEVESEEAEGEEAPDEEAENEEAGQKTEEEV